MFQKPERERLVSTARAVWALPRRRGPQVPDCTDRTSGIVRSGSLWKRNYVTNPAFERLAASAYGSSIYRQIRAASSCDPRLFPRLFRRFSYETRVNCTFTFRTALWSPELRGNENVSFCLHPGSKNSKVIPKIPIAFCIKLMIFQQ